MATSDHDGVVRVGGHPRDATGAPIRGFRIAPSSGSARPSGAAKHSDGLEQELHHGDVEPAVELAADLALDADELEAAPGVERPRRRSRGLDAGDHGVEPRRPGDRRRAGSAAPCRSPRPGATGRRTRSPRRWCGRRPAPCTARARRTRRPCRPPSTATMAEKAPDRAASQSLLVGERAGDEVERARRRPSPRCCRSSGSPRRRRRSASRTVISPMARRGYRYPCGSPLLERYARALARRPLPGPRAGKRPLSSVGRAQPW